MTLMELNVRIGAIVTEAETSLRALINQGAAAIQAEYARAGKVIDVVKVALPGNIQADIDRTTGAISVSGGEVEGFLQLKTIAEALAKAPGFASAITADVKEVIADVEVLASDVKPLLAGAEDFIQHPPQ